MQENQDSDEQQKLVLAALNAEIEYFAKSDIKPDAEHVPPAMLSTGFPRLDGATQAPAHSPSPSCLPPAEQIPRSPPSTGGLLARLKQQAAEKLASEAQRSDIEDRLKQQISDSLQSTYLYLRDLLLQINIVKPAYPADYYLSDQLVFDGLVWQEGRTDYRKLDDATDEQRFERVSLRYLLANEAPIVLEKESPAMELLNRTLHDYDLRFELEEFKNARARVERARFTIRREVRAGLLFVADYEMGDIRLRTLNVQRFGSAEYRIPADALDHDAVEEMAMFVLGESNQFVRRFTRVA